MTTVTPTPTADMLHWAFCELGLPVTQTPEPGETLTHYMNRCPQDAVLAVVHWGFHGERP